MGSQLQVFDRCAKSGTISQWLKHANASALWTHIASLDFDLWSSLEASSATRGHGSSLLCGAQKNRVQGMWPCALGLVRQDQATRSRFVCWQHADLSGIRGSSACVPMLRPSEARATGVPCRQSALHKALRLVRRTPLSGQHDQGCCRRTESGLANGQGIGQAVHARASARPFLQRRSTLPTPDADRPVAAAAAEGRYPTTRTSRPASCDGPLRSLMSFARAANWVGVIRIE